MNILDLEEKLKELLILESNLKKSIYKKFLHKTLLEKQRLNNQLYDYVQTGLINLEDSLSESKLTYFEKASRQAFLCVQQILNTKLAHTKRTIPFKTLVSTIIILRRLKTRTNRTKYTRKHGKCHGNNKNCLVPHTPV